MLREDAIHLCAEDKQLRRSATANAISRRAVRLFFGLLRQYVFVVLVELRHVLARCQPRFNNSLPPLAVRLF